MKHSPTQSTQRVVVLESAGYDLFLSRRVLTELGVLSMGFPNNIVKPMATSATSRSCGCQASKMVLPLPEMPAAGMASRDELVKLLLEHNWSSTFNMCEHQQLPAMSGTPLQVILKEGATIPTPEVPKTFKKKVKGTWREMCGWV